MLKIAFSEEQEVAECEVASEACSQPVNFANKKERADADVI